MAEIEPQPLLAATEIVRRCERRIGQLVREGQERGDVLSRGQTLTRSVPPREGEQVRRPHEAMGVAESDHAAQRDTYAFADTPEQAARAVGVSKNSVERARLVAERAPDLVPKVESGPATVVVESGPATVVVVGRVTRAPRRSEHPAVVEGERVPKAHLGLAVLSGLDRTGLEVRIAGPDVDEAIRRIRRGTVVTVTGELRCRTYTASDGVQRAHHVFLAHDVAVHVPHHEPEPAA